MEKGERLTEKRNYPFMRQCADRETQILDIGYVWIPELRIYHYSVEGCIISASISMLDLVALHEDDWDKRFERLKASKEEIYNNRKID